MSYDFPAHESTRKRRRWGCTCGCVMLLIVLIIFGVVFFYLGLKPHEEFRRFAMMDGETDGFGVLRVNPEDEGMQEFTEFLLGRLQKAHKANPETAGQAQVISALMKVSKNVLSQFFQPETVIYATYNPITADENILITAPLKNRISWVALRQFVRDNIAAEPVSREGVAEIYSLYKSDTGTSTLLSLDPNDLVISDSHALLTKGLGYAKDYARNASPTTDLQYFIDELALDQPPEGEDLAVAMVNEESRITNMIFVFEDFIGISGISERVAAALSAQQLTFADISGMKLTADLASNDLLKGELTMYCPSSQTAARLAKVFETALPHLTGEDVQGTFNIAGKVVGRGVTVVISLEISGLKKWIETLIPVAPPAADPAAADQAGAAEEPAVEVESAEPAAAEE